MLRPQFTKKATKGRSPITGMREPVQSNASSYFRTLMSYVRRPGRHTLLLMRIVEVLHCECSVSA